MIAVIFEVVPSEGQGPRYFELAGQLSATLSEQDGFVSVERFESLTHPGRYLSLSFWQDEQAVAHWRNQDAHRDAQQEGRLSTFESYRLRVASVIRDYGQLERDQAPTDSRTALR
jgi:heme-degrading monooxygenase HmoA